MKSTFVRRSAGFAILLAVAAGPASAGVITQWSFENITPITGTTVVTNNSPIPSTGTGTASSIGMDVYPTPNVGVTTDDVLLGVAGDTGTNTIANTSQIWRIRAQAGANGAANGWSSAAPIATQGAVFSASTAGFNAINVSFDWYATNAGEANLQLEYTTDGTTWHNVALANSSSAADVSILTNSTSANTVNGSYASMTGKQQWIPGLTATISDPLAANNPNFAIEMVNASTGADDVNAGGTALNNSSGNWRFDNVTISGTAVTTPEPASLGFVGIGAMALLSRRRRISR